MQYTVIIKHHRTALVLLCLCMICSLQPALAQEKLRIISYNILEGMKNDTTPGKQAFADWLKSYDPDIVALQECNKFTQVTLEELAHKYGHPYAILVKEKGYPVGLTSKYPIVNVQKVTDNMTHGFIVARIKDLNFMILHLNPHKYQKRREEIQEILGTIAAAPSQKKWLMMGDFNSFSPLDNNLYADGKVLSNIIKQQEQRNVLDNLVDRKAIDFEVQQRILDFGFKDTGKAMENGTKPRYAARIDYIYVTKDLLPEVTTSHFIYDDFTANHSDHKPVIMEFKHKR